MKKEKDIPWNLPELFFRGTRFKLRKTLGYAPGTPFMKFREISLLREILQNLQPMKCLEYGSGYSSHYFIKFLPKDATWLSVEHDKEWYELLTKEKSHPRVNVQFVPPDGPLNENLEDPAPFQTYINFPEREAPFDFILVDGRVRATCIEKGFSMLSEQGVLVIHDANKTLYQEALEIFPNWLILEDYRRSAGGVGIGTKSRAISALVSIDLHTSRWETVSKAANIFKFKWLLGKKTKPFRVKTSKLK